MNTRRDATSAAAQFHATFTPRFQTHSLEVQTTSRDPETSSRRGAVGAIKIPAALAGAALIVWIFMRAPLAGLLLVGISLMWPQLTGKRSEG